MKRKILLSCVVASTLSFGAANSEMKAMQDELKALKAEVAAMKSAKAAPAEESASSSAIEKLTAKVNAIKEHDANDNIKWGADLRTANDSLNYTMADGTKKSNNTLMTTRLWLNMAYNPDANNIFKGQLSYNKAFGADFGGNGTGAMPRGWGMDTFDWITNESLSGNALKVRQAYWLYMGDSIGNADIPWTVSVGRRPSTGGMLANLREDDEAQSPLAHMINVEFDGASAGMNLGNVSGIPGLAVKLCLGQGSTNASPMFGGSTNYTDDQNTIKDIKLAGVIITPYDDGQYTAKLQVYRAWDLPGYDPTNMEKAMNGAIDVNQNGLVDIGAVNMSQFGDIDGYTLSGIANGIGDGMFADTKVFASLAMSKTHPNGAPMLGSMDSKVGTSYWLGAQQPLFGGNFGLEYNHGSKYWRPFDYGEDTMAGSKLAARGDAYEAYYTYPITKALSLQARYTLIDYKYTGSNNFFGVDGAPMAISDIKMGAAMGDPTATTMASMTTDKASDLRVYARYRF
jgi:hypothetical protein